MDEPMKFAMQMYRDFVTERIRPWLYFLVILCFQLSGGLYLASLEELMGARCWMREDCLMALFANLTGLAMGFPLLFRTKFRFTNKQLLVFSACGVIAENLITMYCDILPIVWLASFFGGYCKIQGTFECFSNIQLWITPSRDFRVFFPVLHIFVLGAVCLSAIIGATLTYYMGWQMMHWFVILLMLFCLLFFTICLKSIHHIPHIQPFRGIDWSGAFLIVAQEVYILNYGEWADWWNNTTIRTLTFTATITLFLYLWRTFRIEHPIIELKMWKYDKVIPTFILSLLLEALMASERVLEEIWTSEVMHYDMLTRNVSMNAVGIVGILLGCAFSYFWLVVRRERLFPLLEFGVVAVIAYLILCYTRFSTEMTVEMLYPAIICRQFASAVLGICLLTALQSFVGFMHYFQCLAIFQLIHLCVGGVIGSALYGEMFKRYVAENMMRYGGWMTMERLTNGGMDMATFVRDVLAVSVKTVYGWGIWVALFTLLAVCVWDYCLRYRRIMRNMWMPEWSTVRRFLALKYKN